MIKKPAKINTGQIYEHLEYYLKKTTWTDRWRWLKEANAFVDAVEKRRKKGKLFKRKYAIVLACLFLFPNARLAESSYLPTVGSNIGIGTFTPVGALTIMNGNVGVGTWSPTAKLQVTGTVTATAFSGDGSALTNVSAGGWTDGGINVYTSTTTDNVGVGTTTPTSTLEIVKTAAGREPLMVSRTGDGDGNMLLIQSDGNVGIGTTTPVAGLTVMNGKVGVGTWSPSGMVEIKTSGTDKDHLLLTGNPTDYATIRRGASTGGIELWGGNAWDTGGSIYLNGNTFTPASDAGSVQVMLGQSSSNFEIYGSDTNKKVVVTDAGNIGVGTWSPTAKLQVTGTVAATAFSGDGSGLTNLPASGGWTDGGTNVYITTSTDNVGIGTITPMARLQVGNGIDPSDGSSQFFVNSAGDALMGIRNSGSNIEGILRTHTGDSSNLIGVLFGAITNHNLSFYTNYTARMVITTGGNVGIGTLTPLGALTVMNGNVGIGTSNPSSRLQVIGAVAATSFAGDGSGLTGVTSGGWTDGGTSVYTTATSDNVGIGTTTPKALFQVGNGTDTSVSLAQLFVNSSTDTYIGVRNSLSDIEGFYGTYVGSSTVLIGSLLGTITDHNLSFLTNNTSRMVITNTGNAGIGTVTPVGGLAVMNGNVGIGTWIPTSKVAVIGTVSATAFVGDGSGLTGISAGGWTDGGTNVYNTTTTDNVGIGTTTPNSATLEIVKNAAQPALKISSNATANGDYLVINSQGKVGIGTFFPNGGLVVMNGSVGIGTWSPVRSFEIKSGNNGGLQLEPSDGAIEIASGNDALSYIDFKGYSYLANDFRGRILYQDDFGFKISMIGSGSPSVVITEGGNLGIGTIAPVGGFVVMSGNAGIGTWSPAQRLQVVGTVAATAFSGDGSGLTNVANSSGWTDGGTNVYVSTTTDTVAIGTTTPMATVLIQNVTTGDSFRVNDEVADGSPFLIDSDGRVGIGTTGPMSEPLVVVGAIRTTASIRTADGNAGNPSHTFDNSGTEGLYMPDVNILGMVTSGVERARIDPNGNIGIGTTTPVGALTIMNGNVGIGTWSPTAALEIKATGSAQITINGASGGCLMVRDTDNAGWTECNTLNGVVTCSIDADGICDGS